MPRVHTIESARPSTKPRTCRRCGHEIQVGEAYRYFSKRLSFRGRGVLYIYCKDHSPLRSELLSGRSAQLAEIEEAATDAIDKATSIEELQDALDAAIADTESLADEIRDSVSNIEDGFGHPTSQSEELEDKASSLDDWIQAIETAKDDIQDDCTACLGDGELTETCDSCGGSGKNGEEECPDCDGSGTCEDECPDCGGSGKTFSLDDARQLASDAIAENPDF